MSQTLIGRQLAHVAAFARADSDFSLRRAPGQHWIYGDLVRPYARAQRQWNLRARSRHRELRRISIDGRATGAYAGRVPGVVEEALYSVRWRKPLYVCGVFGGAAHDITLLLTGQMPEHFSWSWQMHMPYSEEMRQLFENRDIKVDDYREMAAEFSAFGVHGLSECNGLTPDESLELFVARNVTRIVERVVNGLSRVLP